MGDALSACDPELNRALGRRAPFLGRKNVLTASPPAIRPGAWLSSWRTRGPRALRAEGDRVAGREAMPPSSLRYSHHFDRKLLRPVGSRHKEVG